MYAKFHHNIPLSSRDRAIFTLLYIHIMQFSQNYIKLCGSVCSIQTSFSLWFRVETSFMHYNKCMVWYKLGHHGNHSNQNSLWMHSVLSEWSIIILSSLNNKKQLPLWKQFIFVQCISWKHSAAANFCFKWTYIRTYQTEQTTLECGLVG